MQPDVALEEVYKELYPFSEIVGNANVLIMPGRHSAAISFKLMKSLILLNITSALRLRSTHLSLYCLTTLYIASK